MVTQFRIYVIIIMTLILIFSFIHLGVSIGIICQNRGYGSMFRPEIGLSAFNIVISFLGIVVSAFGLFCILTNKVVLGKFVAVISGILGIFALTSLVTALIINAKSMSYVSTRFFNNMNGYPTNSDARNIIDRLQTKYKCCGATMWLDWARVQSGTTTVTTTTSAPMTTTSYAPVTTTTSTIVTTITPAVGTSTTPFVADSTLTTLFEENTTPIPIEPDTIPITPSEGDTTLMSTEEDTTPTILSEQNTTNMLQTNSSVLSSRIRRNARRQIYPLDLLLNPSILAIRRRRQAVSTSLNMISIPYSIQVSVPTTCCINRGSSSNGSSQSTCTSSNQFYTKGCLTSIVNRANEQDMGIGIINCFMIVLAFAAIPLLLRGGSTSDIPEEEIYKQQMEYMKQFHTNLKSHPTIITTYH